MYNFVVAASVHPNYADSSPVEKREIEGERELACYERGRQKKREATFDIRITTHGVRTVKNRQKCHGNSNVRFEYMPIGRGNV